MSGGVESGFSLLRPQEVKQERLKSPSELLGYQKTLDLVSGKQHDVPAKNYVEKRISPDEHRWNDVLGTLKNPAISSLDKQSLLTTMSQSSDWHDFLSSSFFNKQLGAAQSHPDRKDSAYVFQIYGKLVLRDSTVVVDGVWGPQTKNIFRRYQESRSLKSVSSSEKTPAGSSSSHEGTQEKLVKKDGAKKQIQEKPNEIPESFRVGIHDEKFAQIAVRNNPEIHHFLDTELDPVARGFKRTGLQVALTVMQNSLHEDSPLGDAKNMAFSDIDPTKNILFDGKMLTLSHSPFVCSYDMENGSLWMNDILHKHTSDSHSGYTLGNVDQKRCLLQGLPSFSRILETGSAEVASRKNLLGECTDMDLRDIRRVLRKEMTVVAHEQKSVIHHMTETNYVSASFLSLLPPSLSSAYLTENDRGSPLFSFVQVLYDSFSHFTPDDLEKTRALLERFTSVITYYQNPHNAGSGSFRDPWFSLLGTPEHQEKGVFALVDQISCYTPQGKILDLKKWEKELDMFDQKHVYPQGLKVAELASRNGEGNPEAMLAGAYV